MVTINLNDKVSHTEIQKTNKILLKIGKEVDQNYKEKLFTQKSKWRFYLKTLSQ